jgi:hypothetical protein
MVLLIERASKEMPAHVPIDDLGTLIKSFEDEGLDEKAALKKAAKRLGISRSEAYRRTKVKK